MMRSTLTTAIMLGAGAAFALPAAAQDLGDALGPAIAAAASAEPVQATGGGGPGGAASDDGWDVSFTPYLWVAGIKGDIGVPRNSDAVNVDQSFLDTLSKLDFAFMGAIDVQHDRFVMLGDLIYLDLGTQIESSADPRFQTGTVDSATLVAMAAVGYRVVDEGALFVDVFAGGRVVALDADVALTGPLATRTASASTTSLEPLVGARIRAPLSKNLALGVYGDAGGLVSGSDVEWQLMGNLQFRLSRHWSMVAGYRHMAIDHTSTRLNSDIAMSGPILGVTYTF